MDCSSVCISKESSGPNHDGFSPRIFPVVTKLDLVSSSGYDAVSVGSSMVSDIPAAFARFTFISVSI